MKRVTERPPVRIGISGWRYPGWRNHFYPRGLPQRMELAFASRVLSSVEINGTFYSLQTPVSYQRWHDETPDDFLFSVKGPRYITHMLRLRKARIPLANFLASGLFALGAKLGPVLWQFPPTLSYEPEGLDAFLSLLPHEPEAALALAGEHDTRLGDRIWLQPPVRRLRHAIEVRHPSFKNPDFIAMLRRHGVALVVADTADTWPLLEDLTAGFVYLRLHGDKKLYASGYGPAALDRWAARLDAWQGARPVVDAKLAAPLAPARPARREVFCYFDNDIKVHAPYDAAALAARLGLANGLDARGRFSMPADLLGP